MTKARARQRAKAKASDKSMKRDAGAAPSAAKSHPDHFDPGTRSITSLAGNLNANRFGGARRGTSRSK